MKRRLSGPGCYCLPAIAASVLLAACASNETEATASASYESEEDSPFERTSAPRCDSGYTLQCEARSVGRIRFSSFKKKDLDKCGCVPFEGAPVQGAIPGLERAY